MAFIGSVSLGKRDGLIQSSSSGTSTDLHRTVPMLKTSFVLQYLVLGMSYP